MGVLAIRVPGPDHTQNGDVTASTGKSRSGSHNGAHRTRLTLATSASAKATRAMTSPAPPPPRPAKASAHRTTATPAIDTADQARVVCACAGSETFSTGKAPTRFCEDADSLW